jgi:hypothetical protein
MLVKYLLIIKLSSNPKVTLKTECHDCAKSLGPLAVPHS